LAGTLDEDAEIPIELIPVQLNPAVLESKARTRNDQPKKEEAEHGYPGIQQRGAPITCSF
jgi:hypothetical protein